ncbi:MAG: acyltransferase family protein [Lachnospiraceae bacterium]|nr:acyltransferase family protein [Lachnospiraceae bacterium]
MDTLKGNKRIDSVDILRAVGILIMVMGHVGFGGVFDRYIHSFHMPIFFLISGFLFVPKKEVGVGLQILKRAGRLLIPYVFYAIINYLFWILLIYDKEWYVPLLNAVTYNTQGLPISGALWFLTAMFFAEAYYMILDRVIKNEIVRSALVIFVSVVASFLQNITSFRLPLTIDTAVVCMGFLELGRILKHIDQSTWMSKIKQRKILVFILAVVLLCVNVVLSFVNEYVNIKSGWYGFVPLFWINALIGSAAYLTLAIWFDSVAAESNIIRRILVVIGRRSMIFLGLNQLVILLLSVAYSVLRLPYNFYISGVIIFAATAVVLYLLCLLIGIIKIKPIKKLFGI